MSNAFARRRGAAARAARRATADEQPVADINTTPLIDVMLVLLIMLIITIPIQLHATRLDMPNGAPPVQTEPPPVLRLDIDGQGLVHWNGEVVVDHRDLERRIVEAVAQPTQPEVHLRPDRDARYDVIAGVLASAQRLGMTRIGIVGSEQFLP